MSDTPPAPPVIGALTGIRAERNAFAAQFADRPAGEPVHLLVTLHPALHRQHLADAVADVAAATGVAAVRLAPGNDDDPEVFSAGLPDRVRLALAGYRVKMMHRDDIAPPPVDGLLTDGGPAIRQACARVAADAELPEGVRRAAAEQVAKAMFVALYHPHSRWVGVHFYAGSGGSVGSGQQQGLDLLALVDMARRHEAELADERGQTEDTGDDRQEEPVRAWRCWHCDDFLAAHGDRAPQPDKARYGCPRCARPMRLVLLTWQPDDDGAPAAG